MYINSYSLLEIRAIKLNKTNYTKNCQFFVVLSSNFGKTFLSLSKKKRKKLVLSLPLVI